MYIPLIARVLKEDLGPDAPPWSEKLTYALNTIIDYLKVGFAKNITLQENLQNPTKSIQLVAGATPASNTISFLVSLPQGYQPIGIQILNCIDLSGTIVGNAVTCEMQPGLTNGNVTVRAIYGLTAGQTYQLTFLVW